MRRRCSRRLNLLIVVATGLLATVASFLLIVTMQGSHLYPPLPTSHSSSSSSSSSSSLGSIKYSRVRVIRSATVDNYSTVDEQQLPSLTLPHQQQQQQQQQQRVLEKDDGQRLQLDAEAGREEGGGGDDAANGYLSRNGSNLEFHSYGADVDLRIVVFAFDRPSSLNTCLTALEEADYAPGDRVSLHVWIDRAAAAAGNDSSAAAVDAETLAIARGFNFTRGRLSVHVHATHVGVQGQWMNAWRPGRRTKEIALLLEDDITVSPFFWRWLKRAHAAYARLNDVSGFSVSHPEMEHKNGGLLEVPVNDTIFMYRVICTWGFSPQPDSWRAFQDWFQEVERNGTFVPVVRGILPTEWFLSERNKGNERTLWEQWHIYYTDLVKQYTVMLNPGRRGLLAVNRHEMGLHDGHVVVGATQPLCADWSPQMDRFPETLPKYGYDGLRETAG